MKSRTLCLYLRGSLSLLPTCSSVPMFLCGGLHIYLCVLTLKGRHTHIHIHIHTQNQTSSPWSFQTL